jgi:hypothetical protein
MQYEAGMKLKSSWHAMACAERLLDVVFTSFVVCCIVLLVWLQAHCGAGVGGVGSAGWSGGCQLAFWRQWISSSS